MNNEEWIVRGLVPGADQWLERYDKFATPEEMQFAGVLCPSSKYPDVYYEPDKPLLAINVSQALDSDTIYFHYNIEDAQLSKCVWESWDGVFFVRVMTAVPEGFAYCGLYAVAEIRQGTARLIRDR